MTQEYLDFMMGAIGSTLDAMSCGNERPWLEMVMMCRFFNCDSLLDLSQTFEVPRERLYESLDVVGSRCWLRRLQKVGRERLAHALAKFHAGDRSYQSRHAITICVDDFTRTARGDLGGWTGFFYSGAEGRVVHGINMEVLVAVIGDGDEVILLDVRIVPPAHEGPGRRPDTRNDWFRKRLLGLVTYLATRGLRLQGCYLSVDAAYVSAKTVETARDLGVPMVSKLAANRTIEGNVWRKVRLQSPAWVFGAISAAVNEHAFKPMRGEIHTTYFRHTVSSETLGDILLVTFRRDDDIALYFSTDPAMKAITLRNIIRYRWQIERVFWVLRQDLGIGDIHHHRPERVAARHYLLFILAQAIRDCANAFNCSPKDILRDIRRHAYLLPRRIGIPCAFVPLDLHESASAQAEAA